MMSVKSSARIKKRRSAEAAAAATASTSSGAFAAANNARLGATSSSQNNNSNTNSNSNSCNSASSSGNSHSNPNGNQSANKKQHFVGRNPNFDTDETKLLIQLWGDPKLQRTLITTHKKHAVICQLAAKMQEYGYHRSPEEITTRIKNLKCFYNRLKKDKECGLSGESEPSWKHFAEMDAIMTRPIFSVRPNEVPAPSLKYQLEQALEEHAERRKRRQENGEELSESENEEDDMILSSLVPNAASNGKSKQEAGPDADGQVRIEIETPEEAIVTHTIEKRSTAKRRKVSSEPDVEIGEAVAETAPRIKTEPANQTEPVASEPSKGTAKAPTPTDVEEDDDCMLLPLPKEEPIDVDAADESGDDPTPSSAVTANPAPAARPVMPTLADMLQLPKATNLLPYSGANVIIPANSISTSVAQLSNTVSTSVAANNKLSPGKISLVPTNFLMQPKQSNAQASAKSVGVGMGTAAGGQLQLLQGARLMISGTAPTPVQAASPNSGIVTGPGGVKFVLVNAEQAAKAAAAAAAGNKPSPSTVTTTSLPPPQQLQKQPVPAESNPQQQQQPKLSLLPEFVQKHQQQQFEKKEEKRRALEKARVEQQSKRHMTTMRILLRQLLNAQNEANEIQHNRLSLERERLDWEKSIGERLFTVLPTLLQPAAVPAANVVPAGATHQSPQFIVSGTAAAGPGGAAQRLQPPKLLFTTALPMANGTVSMPHILTPSNALATSLPKVIAAPATSSSSSSAAASGGGTGTLVAKPIEICSQLNDVQLVTPKLEKEA